jgi:hypothetical protein
MVEMSEEEMVQRASQHLAELRLMLEDVEERLGEEARKPMPHPIATLVFI